jgi:nitroimidazol reductase NimA-like FMN-containing flavoprotein (pyridoxamine 5'-phosphate oxidase superfamily)
MPAWKGAWSTSEATAYLRESTVPIRLACRTPSGGLWMLSLWYAYHDGEFLCATGSDADVVRYLEADAGVAFEVSDNEPPYRGVRGSGTVTIEADEEKTLLRELLERYLGGTDNSLADRLLDDDREEVALRITPEKLYTWDFTDRMADSAQTDDGP